ncbi:MAG: RNA polymerase sigma factor region1.1 domain-containing protein, partial [Candidatus Paceibacterota bacterium]
MKKKKTLKKTLKAKKPVKKKTVKKNLKSKKPVKKSAVKAKKPVKKSVVKAKKPVKKKSPKKSKKNIFTEEKVKKILEKGRERGFITISEFLHFFPDFEKDMQSFENILETIEQEEIAIKEA